MDIKIDQGTVIYGIRSPKYPSTLCYGVIITAKCDIAQNKVTKYYYLTAVDAAKWFSTEHGFQQTFGPIITDTYNKIVEKAFQVELNGDTLLSFPYETIQTIIEEKTRNADKNQKELIQQLSKLLYKYFTFCKTGMTDDSRASVIKNNVKTVVRMLEDIDSGKLHHYYYLPEAAYLDEGIKSKGIIIDLLEISSMTLEDAKKLSGNFAKGITFDNLPSAPDVEILKKTVEETNIDTKHKMLDLIKERYRLQSTYWLDEPDDFVAIDGIARSPWCEHLMQRFSNAFIRIGLDNPLKSDFQEAISSYYAEEKNEILTV